MPVHAGFSVRPGVKLCVSACAITSFPLLRKADFLCSIIQTSFAARSRLSSLQGADFWMITKFTCGQLAQSLVVSCILLFSIYTAGMTCGWLHAELLVSG